MRSDPKGIQVNPGTFSKSADWNGSGAHQRHSFNGHKIVLKRQCQPPAALNVLTCVIWNVRIAAGDKDPLTDLPPCP